jgi:hypothetical protein
MAVFWFRHRGTRAMLFGLAAFGLGLAAIVAFAITHAVFGSEATVSARVFFAIHIVICVVEMLLLGAVISLREPPSRWYKKFETVSILILLGLAVVAWGVLGWKWPAKQDELVRWIASSIPFLIVIAIAARFGSRPVGFLGIAVFATIGISDFVYLLYKPESNDSVLPLQLADFAQVVAYFALLSFFYAAGEFSGNRLKAHRQPD